MNQPVARIRARNFRSLADVNVSLAPLSVMIGPNGSGKTNLLNVLRFLATTVRFDLSAALQEWRCLPGLRDLLLVPVGGSARAESVIPAVSAEKIAAALSETDWRAGELWFSGALGGVPQ